MPSYEQQFEASLAVLDEAPALPLPELVEQEGDLCWRFVQAPAQVAEDAEEADVEFDVLDAIHRLGHGFTAPSRS